MSLKKLSQFEYFDWDSFAKDKVFVANGTRPWRDYDTGEELGTNVEVYIAVDKTPYKTDEGETVTNRGSNINIKVPTKVDIPMDARVVPEGVTAKVYAPQGSKYRNELSVKSTGIRTVNPKQS